MVYCIQGSCDATQPMNNMDTSGVSNVDNLPLSSAEPFQFTASMETHSTPPAANNDTSANITSTEDGLATSNTSMEDEMFSTPDGHGSIPLIHPLSQSPHVPGKTPHTVMTQSKLFTTTSAADATVPDSHHVDIAQVNDALLQAAESDATTTVDDNVISKTDEPTTRQQDAEHSVGCTTEQLSPDSVGVVKKENIDVSTAAAAVTSGGEVDKDLVTTTVITHTVSSDDSGTQVDAPTHVKGTYTHIQ